jgi:hypothetical protein
LVAAATGGVTGAAGALVSSFFFWANALNYKLAPQSTRSKSFLKFILIFI